MIEVERKEKETSTSLIRRFTRKMNEAGVLKRVRGLRFKQRSKSALTKKKDALKRITRQKKTDHLKKLGRIE